jgi:hypothetical protein
VSTAFNKRVIAGSIGCLVACGLTAGCELENTGVPQIIPGPSVPSPVPLRAPYVWDAREDLVVWIQNPVSRGSFAIDTDDSNGAIAIQVAGTSALLVLRGPDIEPPAQAIRAVRIRYRWSPDRPSDTLSMWVAFDAINSTPAEVQPRAFATLTAAPGWQEKEFRYETPLDVRYVYFGTYSLGAGVLKLDAITLAGG